MIRPHQDTASLRCLAACGVIVAMLDIVVMIGLAAIDPEVSHLHQYISELGEDGRPYAALFNAWSILYGLLFAGFALAIGRGLNSRPVLGACLTIAACSFVTAVFPCDPGCAGQTAAGKVHVLSGYVSLPAIIMAPTFAWFAMKENSAWHRYRLFTIASVVLLVASTGWLAFCHFLGRERERCPVGALQRVIVAVLYLWMATISVRLWQLAGKPAKH